ncbi:MAG: nicotinamide riboside transporter PnuC [Eubacteriales bacterium]|nr:nicotinamide riboside transporter PnuC [Eubacteriales bacterium]
MHIKKSLESFTKFDWALWLTSVLVVTISFVVSGSFYWLSLIASLVGVTALIFLAKGNVIGQMLTVLFSILYAMVSFRFRYYGEMITYLGMTLPTASMAVVTWLRHPYSDVEVKVNHLRKWHVLVVAVLTVIVTFLFYFILKYFGTSNLFFSTISITTSFAAASLMILRSPYYAIAYAGNDIVLIILWILASMDDLSFLPMVFCFVMFFANDLYGYYNWNKMKQQQGNNINKMRVF